MVEVIVIVILGFISILYCLSLCGNICLHIYRLCPIIGSRAFGDEPGQTKNTGKTSGTIGGAW